MNKTVLSIGLNDKDLRCQIIPTKTAMAMVTGDDGDVVRENTIQVTLYDIDFDTIRGLVSVLKEELNQESIAVEVQAVNSMFL